MTQLRIGDAERDAAVAALSDHYAAGRLTRDEFDERAERAWSARFNDDLAPLFADLPANPAVAPSPARKPTTHAPKATSHSPRRRRPPSFAPFAAVAVIALAVLTGMPWLLFGLFWVACAFAGGQHRSRRRPQWQQASGQSMSAGASCGVTTR